MHALVSNVAECCDLQKGEEKEKQEPKVPFSERFSEWLHHKPTGPDDEDTYCGSRNGSKWSASQPSYTLPRILSS